MEKKKSKAKAAGVKGVFLNGEDVVMTSFGKGNQSVVEKNISKDGVESLEKPGSFQIEDIYANNETKKYPIIGRAKIKTEAERPYFMRGTGNDLLDLRSAYEYFFFGRTFSDTFHIQLIYNIMDMEKIIAQQINNIIMEIDTLGRTGSRNFFDVVAYIHGLNTYEEAAQVDVGFDERVKENKRNVMAYIETLKNSERLRFFGDTFYTLDRGRYVQRSDADWYYLLYFLSNVRQACTHGTEDKLKLFWIWDDERELDAVLGKYVRQNGSAGYRSGISEDAYREGKAFLDRRFQEKTGNLDADFVKLNVTSNFKVILDAMGADISEEDRVAEIIRAFYSFTFDKTYKNKGFSIKKLRECLLSLEEYRHISEEKYDSMRSKMYMAIDFVIDSFYGEKETYDFVEQLRGTLYEEEKEDIYDREARKLAGKIRRQVEKIVEDMDLIRDEKISELDLSKHDNLFHRAIKDIRISKRDVTYFAKIMYMMTLLLDGKEINDLLTTLINKFEEIADLLDVMEQRGVSCEFKPEFAAITKAGKFAEDIRFVNSFARMSRPDVLSEGIMPDVLSEGIMLKDATDFLGENLTEEDIQEKFDLKREKKAKGNPETSYRNFMLNNMVKSSRFKYIVRHGNPKELRKLVKNEKVVKFVLGRMDEKLIDRYVTLCGFGNTKEDGIEVLTRWITNLSYNALTSKNDKEERKAIMSLYLLVIYEVVKNLVYVNSRYVIAFHCVERDTAILKAYREEHPEIDACYSFDTSNLNDRNSAYHCVLTRRAIAVKKEIAEDKFNSLERPNKRQRIKHYNDLRVCEYLTIDVNGNLEERPEDQRNEFYEKLVRLRRIYRNQVAHLNAVSSSGTYIKGCRHFKSYFEIYHYIMQRALSEDGVFMEEMQYVIDHGEYSRNLLKYLNAPMGYNLSRFKNLSTNELFDKNEVYEPVKEVKASQHSLQESAPAPQKPEDLVGQICDAVVRKVIKKDGAYIKIKGTEFTGKVKNSKSDKSLTIGKEIKVKVLEYNGKDGLIVEVRKR